MDGLCLIISGGEYAEIPEDLPHPGYVIACDRGWQYAQRLGLTPDLIVGDFDSSTCPETKIRVERALRQKDDTDTMLAARRALDRGFRNITICCAFGGRIDHTLANIQTAAFLVKRGARVRIMGCDTDALVFEGRTERLSRREGWSLSVFSVSDSCSGVTIRGTKYDCEGQTLTNAFPLGVSNEWVADAAEISAESGVLMVVQSRYSEVSVGERGGFPG